MLRLPRTYEAKLADWQKVKADRNELERREKALNQELREAIKAVHAKHGINDPGHPVRVGNTELYLETIQESYGAVITLADVGKRPMTRRAYQQLKTRSA